MAEPTEPDDTVDPPEITATEAYARLRHTIMVLLLTDMGDTTEVAEAKLAALTPDEHNRLALKADDVIDAARSGEDHPNIL